MALSLMDICKIYDEKCDFCIERFTLELEEGELIAMIGESGCGKTTILRIIAGFEMPDSGCLSIKGKMMNNGPTFIPPEKRKIGMVFQDYALFPHMTIEKNIRYGISQLSKSEQQGKVREFLELVGMQGFEKRYPHELSGGEQQRVALARALAPQPQLLLLDEPFSNLDTVCKDRVRDDIRKILKTTNTTAIFVTHDIDDALFTADRMVILRKGRMIQVGTPAELYSHPVDDYVAGFFKSIRLKPSILLSNQHSKKTEGMELNQ